MLCGTVFNRSSLVPASAVPDNIMGCFSIVKNVQLQFFVCFNAEQTSMQTTISIGMLYDLPSSAS